MFDHEDEEVNAVILEESGAFAAVSLSKPHVGPSSPGVKDEVADVQEISGSVST